MNIIAVGVGGLIGAILRYGIDQLVPLINGLPIGTLIANLLGSFILGWFMFRISKQINSPIGLGMSVGIIGSFTTFSTFSVETFSLLARGMIFFAILYVLLTVLGGISLAFAGAKLAQDKGD